MSLTDESIVIESLEGCERCGRDHAKMRFFKLEKPMHVSSEHAGSTFAAWFTHWAMCPLRREPIMMQSSLLHVASYTETKGA